MNYSTSTQLHVPHIRLNTQIDSKWLKKWFWGLPGFQLNRECQKSGDFGHLSTEYGVKSLHYSGVRPNMGWRFLVSFKKQTITNSIYLLWTLPSKETTRQLILNLPTTYPTFHFPLQPEKMNTGGDELVFKEWWICNLILDVVDFNINRAIVIRLQFDNFISFLEFPDRRLPPDIQLTNWKAIKPFYYPPWKFEYLHGAKSHFVLPNRP